MMTNKPRVFVALSVRDEISTSPSLRRELKHSTYHWSVYIELKNSIGTPGRSYDVVFEDHYSNLPDSGGWKYCSEPNGSDFRLLGMIMIGKLPTGMSMDYVDYALKEVPLPAEDAVPLQNCVSWLRQAIKNLQERGCAEKFDVDVFMDEALKSADIWMEERKEGGIPEEIEKINYTSRQFP